MGMPIINYISEIHVEPRNHPKQPPHNTKVTLFQNEEN